MEEEQITQYFISTEIDSVHHLALIDTGSAVNLVKPGVIKTADVKRLQPTEMFPVTLTNNHTATPIGYQDVICNIGDVPVKLRFHVVKELSEKFVIGLPFLKTATINMANSVLYFGDEEGQKMVVMKPKKSSIQKGVLLN